MDLDSGLTFETFVSGPANRLAMAAARRAAEAPGASFNPLFIYAASGLGKSHLLMAIAHQTLKLDSGTKVMYESLEGYLSELESALEGGRRDALEGEYEELELLLLDDVQFLTGHTAAQELLLRTLNLLSGEGKQVVLASDRPPGEIDGLDERLVSRFSGGLLMDIGPPEFETRVAIIRRKSEERGATLEPGVAEAIARIPFRNVRELRGGLNRVLAVQDFEGRGIPATEIAQFLGRELPGFEGVLGQPPAPPEQTEWRRIFESAAEEAEGRDISAARLRRALGRERDPDDPQSLLDRFHQDVECLSAIREGLEDLGNPWPAVAEEVLADPDRLEEAEALLSSAIERGRAHEAIPEGPTVAELDGTVSPLALRVAERLLDTTDQDVSPLYPWSAEDGEEAAELLAAIGRSLQAREPRWRVSWGSAAEFAEDFIRALSAGVAGAWRERWWTLDLLLIHGAEALSEMERAEDEFFHLFESLTRRGAHILIAADRPADHLTGIDPRLRSRFSGGLVLQVGEAMRSRATAQVAADEAAAAAAAPEAPSAETGDGFMADSVLLPEEHPRGPMILSPEEVILSWPSIHDRIERDVD